METKICKKCNKPKPLSEFDKRIINGKVYYRSCIICKIEYNKTYSENNKEKIKESKKQYREKNKEDINEYNKTYSENNKEKIKELHRNYRNKHKQKRNEYSLQYNKQYYNDNKKTLIAKQKDYKRIKRANDPLFNLKAAISGRIRYSFKQKGFKKHNNSTIDILGCTYEEFKVYIESLWEDWMNWDNYGLYNGELNYGWDVDHIIPVSIAENEKSVIELNHHTNLQPLCSKVNRDIKRAKNL